MVVVCRGTAFAHGEMPSARSDAMKRAWIARRTSAQKLAAWQERPTCLSDCGALLTKSASAKSQRLFKQGHDSRLKALAAQVIRGEAPAITRFCSRRHQRLFGGHSETSWWAYRLGDR